MEASGAAAPKAVEQWASDPCGFVKLLWPNVVLTDYQEAILRSLVDAPETWVRSANGVGKSFVAALATLWFFFTRPSIVVTIAPTANQLDHVLWNEIRNLIGSSRVPAAQLGLKVNFREITKLAPDGTVVPKSYIAAWCAAETAALSGVHLARLKDGSPTVLFIIDEASSARLEPFWPVIETSAHRTLAIFNPIRTAGKAWQVCQRGDDEQLLEDRSLHRRLLHVSGEDSPNVKLGVARHKRGLPQLSQPPVPGVLEYMTFLSLKNTLAPWELGPRLYGRFNDESQGRLFPKEWLDFCQAIWRKLKIHEAGLKARGRRFRWGAPFGLGIDCAMGGGDESSWCVYGRFGVAHLETLDTPNTRAIKGNTLRLMRRFKIGPEWVCFDRAIGKGIADEMREEGMEVMDIGFGESALDGGKYPNMRVELYGDLATDMAKLFDREGKPHRRARMMLETDPDEWPKKWRCIALPDDNALLREELFVLPRGQDSKDRLTLPPKEGTKTKLGIKQMLGGRSPDRADSLVLGRYAWEMGREHHQLSRVNGSLVY